MHGVQVERGVRVGGFEQDCDGVTVSLAGDGGRQSAPDADVATTVLPLIRDSARDFARMYAAGESSAYVARPDGYLSFTSSRIDTGDLVTHLSATFGASVSTTATPPLR